MSKPRKHKKRQRNPSRLLLQRVRPLVAAAKKGDKDAINRLDKWMKESVDVRRMVNTLLSPKRDQYTSSSLIRQGKKPSVYSRSVQGGAPE